MSDLIERFDAVIADQWEPHAPPTADSVATIQKCLSCEIPPLLLAFSVRSKSFSSYFLGLGEDYDEHSHVIARNAMVRSHPDWLGYGPKAPDNLVFFTDNFMNDYFWCLDTSRFDREHPIVYWTPFGLDSEFSEFASFEEFITAEVAFYESKRTG